MKIAGLVVLAALVGGCATGGATPAPSASAAYSPSPPAAEIDGLIEVGGHDLYLKCTGEQSPTVLYFHGSIQNRSDMPVENAEPIRRALGDDFRFCAYDRRNVGQSETVDAAQLPDDLMADAEGLLEAAQVNGPFVLLGASFGGLPAYLFANRHPQDVVGMVMLDAMFPDDLTLDELWPEDERYAAYGPQDECCSLERISHFKVITDASEYVGQEPDIPMIYLASEREPINESGPAEYNAAVLETLQGFVDRFEPGRLEWVDAPHFMEVVIPQQIADAVREVVELAGH